MQTNEQFTVAGETGEAGTGELHQLDERGDTIQEYLVTLLTVDVIFGDNKLIMMIMSS